MNAALKKINCGLCSCSLFGENPTGGWRHQSGLEETAEPRNGSGPRCWLNKANPRALSSHQCQDERRQPPLLCFCVVVCVQAPDLQPIAPWSSRSTASCPRSCLQPFLSLPASASCSASCVSPSTFTTATSGEWTPDAGEGQPHREKLQALI